MWHRGTLGWMVVTASALAVGCASGPDSTGDGKTAQASDSPTGAKASEANETPHPPLDGPIAPPPGIDGSLIEPVEGDAADRARLALDAVLDRLDKPAYLPTAPARPATQPTDSDRSGEPGDGSEPDSADGPGDDQPADPTLPLAAQKAYAKGRYLYREERFGDAIDKLEKAKRAAPASASVLTLLGRTWLRAGNAVRAAEYLKQAVQLRPGDGESLYLLGRFAMRRDRWDEAIVLLARTVQAATNQQGNAANATGSASPQDPALVPLTRYFLALSLRNRGYLKAALDQLQRHLEAPRLGRRPTWLSQRLALADQRRGRTWRIVGDLRLRLGQTEQALAAYDNAKREGVGRRLALSKREIYALLRADRVDAAIERALTLMQNARSDQQSVFRLAGYLKDQGVQPSALSDKLQRLYARTDQSGPLALAVADLLPRGEAIELLDRHLQKHPSQPKVLDRLLKSFELSPAGDKIDTNKLERAATITARAIAAHPEANGEYASMLVDRLTQPVRQQLVHLIATHNARLFESDERAGEARLSATQLILGVTYKAMDQPEAAIKALTAATQHAPSLPAARIALARLQLAQGKAKAAQQTIAPLPDASKRDILSLRLAILEARGQTKQALALVDQLMERQGQPAVELLLQKARLLVQQDRPDQAAKLLEEAIDTRPKAERLYARLLTLYKQAGSIPDRSERYEQVLWQLRRSLPTSPVLLMELAVRNARRGQSDQAIQLLKRIRQQKPGHGEATALLLQIFRQRGQNQQIIELARKALREPTLDTPMPVARMLWQYLIAAEKPKQARKQIKAAIERFPEHRADLRHQLSLLYQQRGKREAAARVMQQTLKESPDHTMTQNGLAYLWAQQGKNLDRALELANQALDSMPESVAILDTVGWVHYKRGEFKQALNYLKQARQQLKQQTGQPDPIILSHLGDAYYRLDQPMRAINVWTQAREALANQPDRPARSREHETLGPQLKAKLEGHEKPEGPPLAPVPGAEAEQTNDAATQPNTQQATQPAK